MSEEVKPLTEKNKELAEMYQTMIALPAWEHFEKLINDLAEKCHSIKSIPVDILPDDNKLAYEVRIKRIKHDTYKGILNRVKNILQGHGG